MDEKQFKTKFLSLFFLVSLTIPILGCSPEVGSINWCEKLKQKPTRDWNEEEIKSYAQTCLFYKY